MREQLLQGGGMIYQRRQKRASGERKAKRRYQKMIFGCVEETRDLKQESRSKAREKGGCECCLEDGGRSKSDVDISDEIFTTKFDRARCVHCYR